MCFFRLCTGDFIKCSYFCPKSFAEVVTTISRSARQCVLRLSEDKVSFASLESGVLGGVNLWCELSQARSLHNIHYKT